MTFGEKLKEHRKYAGISQVRLSEQSGIDRTYVSRLEDGSRRPSVETMWQLGNALNLNIYYIEQLWLLVLLDGERVDNDYMAAAQVAAP